MPCCVPGTGLQSPLRTLSHLTSTRALWDRYSTTLLGLTYRWGTPRLGEVKYCWRSTQLAGERMEFKQGGSGSRPGSYSDTTTTGSLRIPEQQWAALQRKELHMHHTVVVVASQWAPAVAHKGGQVLFCDDRKGWGGAGREDERREDLCIHTADSTLFYSKATQPCNKQLYSIK